MFKYEKEPFSQIVKNAINLSDICRKLRISISYGNRQTIKKYIEKYKLNTSHFTLPKNNSNNNFKKIPISEILIENSVFKSPTSFKKRLYKEGLLKRECYECGQDENWMGKHMSLRLDHINGITTDNRIENLRILCPNCDATMPTFSGRNINGKYKYKTEKKKRGYPIDTCECGKNKSVKAKTCYSCKSKKQQTVTRPQYEQLMQEIEETNYCAVGRKYGVSDNAIRKWVKNYEKIKILQSD